MNNLLGEWSSERMCRAKLTVLLAIEAGVEPEKLPHRAVSHVGFFWRRIGYLVRSGHMDRKLVHRHLGPQVQIWQAWLRTEDWEDFTWLAKTSAAMDVEQKAAPWLTPTLLADHVPASITHFRDAIELEESLPNRHRAPHPNPNSGAYRARRGARGGGRRTGDVRERQVIFEWCYEPPRSMRTVPEVAALVLPAWSAKVSTHW